MLKYSELKQNWKLLTTLMLALIMSAFYFRVPFSEDEHNIWNILHLFSNWEDYFKHFLKYDTQMPLFYSFNFMLKPLGLGSFGLRIQSFVFYISSVLIFNKYLSKDNTLSLAFFSLSPVGLLYAANFRPYALFLLCSTISTALFYSALEGNNRRVRKEVYLLVSLVFLSLCHYFALLISLIILGLYIFYSGRIRKITFEMIIFLLFLVFIVFSFFVDSIIGAIGDFNIKHDYRYMPTLKVVLETVSYYIGGLITGLIFGGLCLYRKRFSFLKEQRFIISALVIIITFLVAFLKSIFFSPTFEARYFIGLLPFFSIIFGLIFKRKESIIFVTLSICLIFHNVKNFPRNIVDLSKIENVIEARNALLLFNACPEIYLKYKNLNYKCIDGFSFDKTEVSQNEVRNAISKEDQRYSVVITNKKIHGVNGKLCDPKYSEYYCYDRESLY